MNRSIVIGARGWVLFGLVVLLAGCGATSPRLQVSGFHSDFTLSPETPFRAYVEQTRNMIARTRVDVNEITRQAVLSANAPFEWEPDGARFPRTPQGKHRKGVLLIHGLSDSPYLIQPIARHLRERGFLVRAVLLPGHGTVPGDLRQVTWQAWVKAVEYGMRTLKADAESVFIGGFSTGGALSVRQSLEDPEIRGVFLFAPAFAARDRRSALLGVLRPFSEWIGPPRDDGDYAKYESFALNGAYQLVLLSADLQSRLREKGRLGAPVFAALSEDDLTVDAGRTLHDLSRYGTSPRNRIVLYTKSPRERAFRFTGELIQEQSFLPEERIYDFSHLALTIPPDDPHYGVNGGYRNCHHYAGDPEKRRACRQDDSVWQGEVSRENLERGVMRRLSYNPLFGRLLHHLDRFLEGLGL